MRRAAVRTAIAVCAAALMLRFAAPLTPSRFSSASFGSARFEIEGLNH